MAAEMALRRTSQAGNDGSVPPWTDVTVHGFRSSFRDWVGDATEFPREVAEAALAHIVGDKAERAYRRGDALARRRVMMATWGEFCASGGGSPKVVAMPTRRAQRA
jgi:integrase